MTFVIILNSYEATFDYLKTRKWNIGGVKFALAKYQTKANVVSTKHFKSGMTSVDLFTLNPQDALRVSSRISRLTRAQFAKVKWVLIAIYDPSFATF